MRTIIKVSALHAKSFMNKVAIQKGTSGERVSSASRIGMKRARAQAKANDDLPAKMRSADRRVHESENN